MSYHIAVYNARMPMCSFAKVLRRALAARPRVVSSVCAIDEIDLEVLQLVHPLGTKKRLDQDQGAEKNCRHKGRQDQSRVLVE